MSRRADKVEIELLISQSQLPKMNSQKACKKLITWYCQTHIAHLPRLYPSFYHCKQTGGMLNWNKPHRFCQEPDSMLEVMVWQKTPVLWCWTQTTQLQYFWKPGAYMLMCWNISTLHYTNSPTQRHKTHTLQFYIHLWEHLFSLNAPLRH